MRLPGRAFLAVVGVVVTAGLAVAAAVGVTGGETPTAAPTGPAPKTVPVTRGTLTNARTVDGTVGFGTQQPVTVKATGTVTWLAPVGSTVVRGGRLALVNQQPVVLLYGPIPAYRVLDETTKGEDVRQFESNLQALGYRGLTVDTTFSAATTATVKLWQKKLGLPETGQVDPALIYFATGALRVAGQLVRLGAASGGDVLTTTTTTKVVTLDVAAGEEGWAKPGLTVSVTVSVGKQVDGVVVSVGTTASAPGGTATGGSGGDNGREGGAGTTPVVLSIVDQAALGDTDGAKVRARYVLEERKDVLSVPVSALVALAEGGYGLEVDDGGATHFVGATIGLFADGRVEVSGPEVHEGLTVRVPS
jgi:peptidoglycan hydrolase-like protein with peptidoglycan-binding domain